MKILRVLAIGATIGGVALATAHEKVAAAEWTPRTVEQIKADMKGNEYTIVWGDTLSGISQATNISVQKLADMNKIANVDLIYAGNKLVFDGNVATVQNNKGETVAQSVIQNEDKVVANQPVGQPVQDTTSNNTTNSATQNTTTPSTDNTVTGNTQTGDQTTGNTGTTTPSTPGNNGGTTQTPTQPSQPDNNGNQNGSTGGNTGGGQTTPSNPGNNEGNQGGSTGGNTGGSTTNPDGPVKMKYTVWAEFPNAEDNAKYGIKEGQYFFDTEEEATAWIDKYTTDLAVNQGISSNSYGVVSWEA
ncbi:TPA: LysM peptidoglycan-binding domain-containing protein [Enterococcus faecium]|nr:LysM peptidoglycan-binding domain-containing protein [Enterococcus faecium]